MLLTQKNPEPRPKTINETIRLFSKLADLDFELGYNDHIYFQYLSNSKDDVTFLDTYHPEEIFDKYIVWVSEKGFTVVDHLSEVYGLPDIHECIDGNLPLRLVLDIDVRQKPDSMNPELPSLDEYKISREDEMKKKICSKFARYSSELAKYIEEYNLFFHKLVYHIRYKEHLLILEIISSVSSMRKNEIIVDLPTLPHILEIGTLNDINNLWYFYLENVTEST